MIASSVDDAATAVDAESDCSVDCTIVMLLLPNFDADDLNARFWSRIKFALQVSKATAGEIIRR